MLWMNHTKPFNMRKAFRFAFPFVHELHNLHRLSGVQRRGWGASDVNLKPYLKPEVDPWKQQARGASVEASLVVYATHSLDL